MHTHRREGNVVIFSVVENLDSETPFKCFVLDLATIMESDTHYIIDFSTINGLSAQAIDALELFRETMDKVRSDIKLVLGTDARRCSPMVAVITDGCVASWRAGATALR